MKKLYLFLLIFNITILPQVKTQWFPAGLNIQPFTANFLEPRAGFSSFLNQGKLRMDIGTSRDVYLKDDGNSSLSFGVDVFTYTRLRTEDNFKFPVETTDFFFGFNAGYKVKNNSNEYGIRIRLSHISAHLSDGQFDAATNSWRGGRNPIVFSKEFLEFFPYYKIGGFRAYLGLTYIYHISPREISKGVYQFGFDYYLKQFPSKLFTPFIAYDFKLSKIESYSINNIFMAGVKFGNYSSKGFSIYYSYISGKSLHGEYFDRNENYSSLGFNFDL